MNLSYHWLDESGRMVVKDGLRTEIPLPVPPGGRVSVEQKVVAPEVPGRYILELDPVFETVAWFSEKNGGKTLRLPVEVLPPGAAGEGGDRCSITSARTPASCGRSRPRPFPWYVIESLLFETGYQAVVLHRIAHWFKSRGIPVLGPLVARFNQFLTGVEIASRRGDRPRAADPPRQRHRDRRLREDRQRAILLHQVTIGSPSPGRIEKMPVIGDGVFIGAGAKVIGEITIGDDVFIGVNAIVARDIPSDSRVLCKSEIEVSPASGGYVDP